MPLTPLPEAMAELRNTVRPVTETETIDLKQGLGRILAVDQISPIQVPPADMSAMDGYAIRVEELNPKPPTEMPVSQRLPAGSVPEPLMPGTAARLFTGSQLPEGANSVVRQEVCEVLDGGAGVRILEQVPLNNNIRTAGQNMAKGQTVMSAGQKLMPQQMGMLASTGFAEVEVFRPLRVAMLCTGDELVAPGSPVAPGQIYSSNNYTLAGFLQRLGMTLIDGGIVADSLDTTIDRLAQAADEADVVITSGGVSVGEEDHVKAAVSALGELNLWQLAIKPGKPLAYGHIKGKPFFGLPGNPVSGFVTFLVLVRPYLIHMQGAPWPVPRMWKIPAGFNSKKVIQRQEYVRARIAEDDDGQPVLNPYSSQDSSMLMSVAWADALAVIPPFADIKKGDMVDALLLDELLS